MSQQLERLICFDVDGTLVGRTVFVWQTLHEYFDTDEEQRFQAYRDYRSGRISYDDWFESDIRLMLERGLDEQKLGEALDRLEPVPGAREVLDALADAGEHLAVVSGSLNVVLSHFGLDGYFSDILINEISFDGEGRLVGWRPTPFDLENKAAGLDWLMAKYALAPTQTVFVGDNFNDVSIAKRAGLSIAFGAASEELVACSTVQVDDSDLRNILPYLLP